MLKLAKSPVCSFKDHIVHDVVGCAHQPVLLLFRDSFEVYWGLNCPMAVSIYHHLTS